MIQDKIVSAAQLAVEQLEPAARRLGPATADVAVNRRERTGATASNGGTILGWNPDELVDTQVTTLQARRPDESAIATLVGYGCQPVTTGYDMYVYSADFPGPLRRVVRAATGGDCVFFQGAAGNVLPRFAFTDDETEAERMGTRIAVAALESVADRLATPVELVRLDEGSVTPISKYRRAPGRRRGARARRGRGDGDDPADAASVARGGLGAAQGVRAQPRGGPRDRRRRQGEGRLLPREVGAPDRGAAPHGTAPTSVEGPVHAVRIGDGVIVTRPGEPSASTGSR